MRDDPEEPWFELSLKSIISHVDKVVFIIDNPNEVFWKVIDKTFNPEKLVFVRQRYTHEDKGADGRQRGAYLRYLQENYLGDWAIVLDSDEVVSDTFYNIREVIQRPDFNVYNIRMYHHYWTLGFEDASLDKHFVPCRLFKITNALSYPQVEHPILAGFEGNIGQCEEFAIHHYGGTRGVHEEILKWKKQNWKSNIHSKEQLQRWYLWHIVGQLPLKPFDIRNHPRLIKQEFEVEE